MKTNVARKKKERNKNRDGECEEDWIEGNPEKGGGVSTIVFGCAYTDVRLQTREGIRTKTELRRYSPTEK